MARPSSSAEMAQASLGIAPPFHWAIPTPAAFRCSAKPVQWPPFSQVLNGDHGGHRLSVWAEQGPAQGVDTGKPREGVPSRLNFSCWSSQNSSPPYSDNFHFLTTFPLSKVAPEVQSRKNLQEAPHQPWALTLRVGTWKWEEISSVVLKFKCAGNRQGAW